MSPYHPTIAEAYISCARPFGIFVVLYLVHCTTGTLHARIENIVPGIVFHQVTDSLRHGTAKCGYQCHHWWDIASSVAGEYVRLGMHSAVRHLVHSVRPPSSASSFLTRMIVADDPHTYFRPNYKITFVSDVEAAAAEQQQSPSRDTSWACSEERMATKTMHSTYNSLINNSCKEEHSWHLVSLVEVLQMYKCTWGTTHTSV